MTPEELRVAGFLDARRAQAEVQKLTDKYVAQVDEAFKKKEAEVMEI